MTEPMALSRVVWLGERGSLALGLLAAPLERAEPRPGEGEILDQTIRFGAEPVALRVGSFRLFPVVAASW